MKSFQIKHGHASDLWLRFLDDIERAKIEIGCSGTSAGDVWFRGEPSDKYHLMPSLFRRFNRPNGKHWDKIFSIEKDLYWEFSARAREAHETVDSWQVLFMMQHFGTPTRLIDWTEVLGVAIYFAIVETRRIPIAQRAKAPSPSIWILNPYALNLASSSEFDDLFSPANLGWDEEEQTFYSYEDLMVEKCLGWDWPLAIYPRQANPRLNAQRGWFTIHGDEFLPIDKMKNARRFLRRVTLPWGAIQDAQTFLFAAGIDHYSLFPDLQNLSMVLSEKYGYKKSSA